MSTTSSTMQILEAKIDWLQDFGNFPKLVITVDKLPKFEGAIYTQQPNGMVYAIQEGVVDFISMGQPTESGVVGGFSSREITRTLTDGTALKSRDCYSGSPSVLDFDCKDVTVFENNSDCPLIATATAITYALAKELIDKMDDTYLIPYVMAKGKATESHWWVVSRSPSEYTKSAVVSEPINL